MRTNQGTKRGISEYVVRYIRHYFISKSIARERSESNETRAKSNVKEQQQQVEDKDELEQDRISNAASSFN